MPERPAPAVQGSAPAPRSLGRQCLTKRA
jgi:hypothetical protein